MQVARRGGRETTGHRTIVATELATDQRIASITSRTVVVMACPDCGVEVGENQKFCHECGRALPAAEPEQPPTQPLDTTVSDGVTTGELPVTEPIDLTDLPDADPAPTEPNTLLLPPPTTAPVDLFDPPAPETVVTEPSSTGEPESVADAITEPIVMDPRSTGEPEPEGISSTEELPTIFDGSADLVEYPIQREPFRVRIIFILSLFGAVAVLMSIVADVIDIRTTRPTAGIATGTRALDDLGSNLGLAAFAGAAVMVLGSLLSCFALRWGAGLAGGAGLALLGWAGLTIGLAEFPIAIAESITRTSPEEFTLRVTRDLGWWLVAAVGVIGVIVFFASLRSIGTGGRLALNPLIAAVTAVAAVVLGFGPLVPVGDATFADNFQSTDPNRDLPTAFFVGRLGQVALIAVVGVVGMLLVRAYGLGMAAGVVSVATVMWVTSLTELGDRPIGIADRNPGATTTVPHAVTSVGMVSTLALLAIAAALATYRLNRRSA